MSKADILSLLLENRQNMLIADCRTFLAAKTMSRETQALMKQKQIGGGNFMMATALLAYLSLLTKVYKLSSNYDKYLDDSGKPVVNETDAFADFIVYLSDNGINLGLEGKNKEELKFIWSMLRNKLMHASTSGLPIAARGIEPFREDIQFLEYENSYKEGWDAPFFEAVIEGSNKQVILSVDRLYVALPRILTKLKLHLVSCEWREVQKVLYWVSDGTAS